MERTTELWYSLGFHYNDWHYGVGIYLCSIKKILSNPNRFALEAIVSCKNTKVFEGRAFPNADFYKERQLAKFTPEQTKEFTDSLFKQGYDSILLKHSEAFDILIVRDERLIHQKGSDFFKKNFCRYSLNVLLTTIGRTELESLMLPSLVNQLMPHDYLTIVSDKNHRYVSECIHRFNFRCPVIHISNPEALGYWGHGSRNKYQNRLMGDFIMNADDDDSYIEGAFDKIRETLTSKNLYIFKHRDGENVAWKEKGVVRVGNIGTSCGIIPNTGKLPTWELMYGGDGRFYEKLSKMMKYKFVDYIIYEVGQRATN